MNQSIFTQPGSYAGPFSDNSPFGFGTGGAAAAAAAAFGTGDYNTWSAPAIISATAVSKAPLQASHHQTDYYRGYDTTYVAPSGGAAANVQHGMAALSLNDPAQRAYGGPPKKSWATIASQPAKPTEKRAPAKPKVPIGNPGRPVIAEPSNNWGISPTQTPAPQIPAQPLQVKQPSNAIPSNKYKAVEGANPPARPAPQNYQNGFASSQEDLLGPGDSKPAPKGLPLPQHQYNPREYSLRTAEARYFVIKSYSEDDIHRSIKVCRNSKNKHKIFFKIFLSNLLENKMQFFVKFRP